MDHLFADQHDTGGIGPTDQLEVIQESTDGPTFIAKDQWINLPVGYNLIDHLNTDLMVTHPDVVFYDFYEAWNTPHEGDKSAYLQNRSGILAQAAPNIGPLVRVISQSFSQEDLANKRNCRCGMNFADQTTLFVHCNGLLESKEAINTPLRRTQ